MSGANATSTKLITTQCYYTSSAHLRFDRGPIEKTGCFSLVHDRASRLEPTLGDQLADVGLLERDVQNGSVEQLDPLARQRAHRKETSNVLVCSAQALLR